MAVFFRDIAFMFGLSFGEIHLRGLGRRESGWLQAVAWTRSWRFKFELWLKDLSHQLH
jgi:hypothetical protein